MSNIELSQQLDILRELQRKLQQEQRRMHMLMVLQERHRQQQYRQGRGRNF